MISQLFLPHRSPNFLKLEFFNIMTDFKKSTYLAQLMLNVVDVDETLHSFFKLQPAQFEEDQTCTFDIGEC